MAIRTATVHDAEAIRRIYNDAVTSSTFVLEVKQRSIAEQRAWLDARTGVHLALVAVDDDEPSLPVLGFGSLSPYKDKACYRTTVEHSVYVDESRRRQGAGRALLAALIEQAADHGFHSMIGRITADNAPSIALHEELGFEQIGREREVGRKFNTWIDVIPMQRLLFEALPRIGSTEAVVRSPSGSVT